MSKPVFETAPDWKETPLRKSKTFRSDVLRRVQLSKEIAERKDELARLNLVLYTTLTAARLKSTKVDDFPVSIVTKKDQVKTDEGEFIRLLVEEAKLGVEFVMKLKKKASKVVKGTSYVMVKGGPDDDSE